MDVTPLKGMPLQSLNFAGTKVTDLTSLRGMKLREFHPPPKDQLTPDSLKLIEEWRQDGCQVIGE